MQLRRTLRILANQFSEIDHKNSIVELIILTIEYLMDFIWNLFFHVFIFIIKLNSICILSVSAMTSLPRACSNEKWMKLLSRGTTVYICSVCKVTVYCTKKCRSVNAGVYKQICPLLVNMKTYQKSDIIEHINQCILLILQIFYIFV